jgi:hypothetical protein
LQLRHIWAVLAVVAREQAVDLPVGRPQSLRPNKEEMLSRRLFHRQFPRLFPDPRSGAMPHAPPQTTADPAQCPGQLDIDTQLIGRGLSTGGLLDGYHDLFELLQGAREAGGKAIG